MQRRGPGASWGRQGLAGGHTPGWVYLYSGWPKVFLASGMASSCQWLILDGKQGAAQHPQLPQAAASSTEREQGPRGERVGRKHLAPPASWAYNRPAGNERCPVIIPLIGLWIFASMEEASSPAAWAQPGARPPRARPWGAGPSCPRSCPSTSCSLPAAPHPAGDAPKSHPPTPPTMGTLGRWPGAAACREPFAWSQMNSSAFLRDSPPKGLRDAAAVTQSSGEGDKRTALVPGGCEEGPDAPGTQAAPAASSGPARAGLFAQGGGKQPGLPPPPPSWGKLGQRKRLCVTRGVSARSRGSVPLTTSW